MVEDISELVFAVMPAFQISINSLSDLLSLAVGEIECGGLARPIFVEATWHPGRYIPRLTRPGGSDAYAMIWLASELSDSGDGVIGLALITPGSEQHPQWRAGFRFNPDYADIELHGAIVGAEDLAEYSIDPMLDPENQNYLYNQLRLLFDASGNLLIPPIQLEVLPICIEEMVGTYDGVGLGFGLLDLEGVLLRSGNTDAALIRHIMTELRIVCRANAEKQTSLGDAVRVVIEYGSTGSPTFRPFILCVSPRLPEGQSQLSYAIHFSRPVNYALVDGGVADQPPVPPLLYNDQKVDLPPVTEIGMHGFDFLLLPAVVESDRHQMALAQHGWISGLMRECAIVALKRQLTLWTIYHARLRVIYNSDAAFRELADPLFLRFAKLYEDSILLDARFVTPYISAFGCLAQWEYEKQALPVSYYTEENAKLRLQETRASLQKFAFAEVMMHAGGIYDGEGLTEKNIFDLAKKYRSHLNKTIGRLALIVEPSRT
jgi:hypothetical protein